jgi:hypothetical protein
VDISLAGRVILNHGWARIDTDKKKWGKVAFLNVCLISWCCVVGNLGDFLKYQRLFGFTRNLFESAKNNFMAAKNNSAAAKNNS